MNEIIFLIMAKVKYHYIPILCSGEKRNIRHYLYKAVCKREGYGKALPSFLLDSRSPGGVSKDQDLQYRLLLFHS